MVHAMPILDKTRIAYLRRFAKGSGLAVRKASRDGRPIGDGMRGLRISFEGLGVTKHVMSKCVLHFNVVFSISG